MSLAVGVTAVISTFAQDKVWSVERAIEWGKKNP